jgi:hypothetical protein
MMPVYQGDEDMSYATTATPVEGALVPESEVFVDGTWWLYFKNDGAFESFKAMPAVVRFGSRYYAKVGWNSDTCAVTYKESRYALPVSVMAPFNKGNA